MHKTKLEIIARLWTHIADLLAFINGEQAKPLEQIQQDIDLTERYFRPYLDCDDDELYLGYIKKWVILNDE